MPAEKGRTRHRADDSGLVLAGASVPLTFQRTLMPRPTTDQAIVTGLTLSTNYALATLTQDAIRAAATVVARTLHHEHSESLVRWFDVAAIGAGVALQRGFAHRRDEPLARAAARTAGFFLATTGAAAAGMDTLNDVLGRRRTLPVVIGATGVLAGTAELLRRRRATLDRDLPPETQQVQTARAIAFGVGVAGGTRALTLLERRAADVIARRLARLLPGEPAVWRPVGHLVMLGALGAAGRAAAQRAFSGIESKEGAVETAFDIAPPSSLLSGSRESHVAFPTLGLQGRRYVWMTTPVDIIEQVAGEPATARPIRVYVGLASADTEEARVELALQELDRTGAFDRSWLMVVSPTGTGYVNYAAVSALELLSRGDCATVAMQYAARPSVLSLARVDEGRRHMRLLLDGIKARLASRTADSRPKVLLFGESLGAWTSQDPFLEQGAQGLVDAGVDRAIWIGTPYFSKWKDRVLHSSAPDAAREQVVVCDSIDDWHALDAETRDRARYVMITHHDDGVALFSPTLAIQAPEWLGDPATRPSKVPRGMRWMPTTTFFQVLIDMKNSANVVPGVFDAKGHDYRADLLPFFHDTLGFHESPERLETMRAWLENREKLRTSWIADHKTAERSLAVAVLERVMEEARANGRDVDAELLRIIREVAESPTAAAG